MASRQAVTRWLLEGDASIRWQVKRDLTHEPAEVVAAERTRVASEGWGAQLPGLQPPEGHWGDDTRHGVKPDQRVAEAVAVVEERQHQNGRWPLNHLHCDSSRVPIQLETEVGSASRWNTLRALRVLDWAAPIRSGR